MAIGDYSGIIQQNQQADRDSLNSFALGVGKMKKALQGWDNNRQVQNELDKAKEDETYDPWANIENLVRKGTAMGLRTMFAPQELENRRIALENRSWDREKLDADMAIKEADYKQADLDNARSHYDKAEEGYRTLFGNANAAWQEYNKAHALDPNETLETTKALKRTASALEGQMEYQLEKSSKYRDYIEKNTGGRKPSNALFADRSASETTEAGTVGESGHSAPAGDDVEALINNFIDAYSDTSLPRNLEKILKTAGIPATHLPSVQKRLEAAVKANRDAEDWKHTTTMRGLDTTSKRKGIEGQEFDLEGKKTAAQMAAGNAKTIQDFIAGNPEFNAVNVAKLAQLDTNFRESLGLQGNSVGSIVADQVKKFLNEDGTRAKYETALATLRNQYQPQQQEKKETPNRGGYFGKK